MNFWDEKAAIQDLVTKAEAKIGTVAVKADLLRDFLARLENAETVMGRQVACITVTVQVPGAFASGETVEYQGPYLRSQLKLLRRGTL
jgi:hypothetical protein